MSHAKKVDRNHGEIRDALRALGWYVYDTSRLGGGFPDLVCAKNGRLVLVEVKDGTLKPSARQLTPAEQDVHLEFALAGIDVWIVESLDDAERMDRSEPGVTWIPGSDGPIAVPKVTP